MNEPVIIVAIITLLGNIILSALQFRSTISQAKEKESLAASNLIERALHVSQEEVKSLRSINADLIAEMEKKNEKIRSLEVRICNLESELSKLKGDKT